MLVIRNLDQKESFQKNVYKSVSEGQGMQFRNNHELTKNKNSGVSFIKETISFVF